MALSDQVSWTVEQKHEALRIARQSYGDEAYIDDTSVVVDDRTVATFRTDEQGRIVMCDEKGE